jgi:hypothetical protein
MIGMTGFVVLALVLLVGVWQDYREEFKKDRNVLGAFHKIIVFNDEGCGGRNYQKSKIDAKLCPAAWPEYVPSRKELMEKKC